MGTVRGEDYDFQFSGRVREGKLQFRLNLEYVGDDSQQDPEFKEPETQRCADPIASVSYWQQSGKGQELYILHAV